MLAWVRVMSRSRKKSVLQVLTTQVAFMLSTCCFIKFMINFCVEKGTSESLGVMSNVHV